MEHKTTKVKRRTRGEVSANEKAGRNRKPDGNSNGTKRLQGGYVHEATKHGPQG